MDFDTGVSQYVTGRATVACAFPIDRKGNPHVKCDFCKYYNRIAKQCVLTNNVIFFPDYISEDCPLDFETTEKENEE